MSTHRSSADPRSNVYSNIAPYMAKTIENLLMSVLFRAVTGYSGDVLSLPSRRSILRDPSLVELSIASDVHQPLPNNNAYAQDKK